MVMTVCVCVCVCESLWYSDEVTQKQLMKHNNVGTSVLACNCFHHFIDTVKPPPPANHAPSRLTPPPTCLYTWITKARHSG